jgi:hypothetical protein
MDGPVVQNEPTPKTSIPITVKVRERLKGFGRKGETYDSLITRLMDIAEKQAVKV